MTKSVAAYLMDLQDRICQELEREDGSATFLEDDWSRADEDVPTGDRGANSPVLGGGGRTRVLSNGAVFEQAGVNFSHVSGASLPPAATAARLSGVDARGDHGHASCRASAERRPVHCRR